MTKYDEGLKKKAVLAYLRGTQGTKAVARQFGVSRKRLASWVMSYRVHGIRGIRKKSTSYSAAFKLKVLRDMWENELSYGQAAAKFDIRSEGNLSLWERQYRASGLAGLIPRQRGRPKMPRPTLNIANKKDEDKTREELIAELNQLRMEVAYGKKLDALVQAKKEAALAKKRNSSSN